MSQEYHDIERLCDYLAMATSDTIAYITAFALETSLDRRQF